MQISAYTGDLKDMYSLLPVDQDRQMYDLVMLNYVIDSLTRQPMHVSMHKCCFRQGSELLTRQTGQVNWYTAL